MKQTELADSDSTCAANHHNPTEPNQYKTFSDSHRPSKGFLDGLHRDFKDCFQLKGRNVRDLTQFRDGRGDRCNSSSNWIHPVELQDNCHNLHRHQDRGEEGVLPPFAQSLPGHPIPHGLLGEDILHPLLLQTLRTPQTTPSQSLPAFFWSRPLSSSLQN